MNKDEVEKAAEEAWEKVTNGFYPGDLNVTYDMAFNMGFLAGVKWALEHSKKDEGEGE